MKSLFVPLLGLLLCGSANAQHRAARSLSQPPACRAEIFEGEVNAGQLFRHAISPALDLMLQPIHSGWILRVLPHTTPSITAGDPATPDYAQLATPPYQSITPLSISTDFAFRAQDAIGWNPRRFRFAPDQAVYHSLLDSYHRYAAAQGPARQQRERELAALVATTPEGVLTILDSQLTPGAADQWAGAAAVSAAFTETAHTLVLPPAGQATPLGRILSLRFRVGLLLPSGSAPASGSRAVPHVCSTP